MILSQAPRADAGRGGDAWTGSKAAIYSPRIDPRSRVYEAQLGVNQPPGHPVYPSPVRPLWRAHNNSNVLPMCLLSEVFQLPSVFFHANIPILKLTKLCKTMWTRPQRVGVSRRCRCTRAGDGHSTAWHRWKTPAWRRTTARLRTRIF